MYPSTRTVLLVLLLAGLMLVSFSTRAPLAAADEMEQVIRGPRTTTAPAPAAADKPQKKSWWSRLCDGVSGFFSWIFGGDPDPRYGRVDAPSGLNVRTGPGTGNKRIGYLSHRSDVTILDEKDGWYKIKYNGRKAWVSGTYVDIIDLESDSPPGGYWQAPEDIESFSYTEVISDSLFTDVSSMTERDIQAFLEKKGSVLAKPYRGTRPSRLIYEACVRHGISPKVMLAKLQMEQGLVSKKSASQHQLDWALGVGCYDSGKWNTRFKGFEKQVDAAAATLKRHYLDGQRKVQGKGYVRMKIDGYSLMVRNAATYSLYRYCPHRSGNRLFYDVFAGFFALVIFFLVRCLRS